MVGGCVGTPEGRQIPAPRRIIAMERALDEVGLTGTVSAGQGMTSGVISSKVEEIRRILGEDIIPGSLNVVLSSPCRFSNETALRTLDDRRLFWRAAVRGTPVWIYRWRGSTLHLAELVSSVHLRKELGLSDGEQVEIRVRSRDVAPLSLRSRLVWSLFWRGRLDWYYRYRGYSIFAERCAGLFRGTQKDMGLLANVKTNLKSRPRVVRFVYRIREYFGLRPRYTFARKPAGTEVDQVQNLIEYGKTSGSDYTASMFPAGYHSVSVAGVRLEGQRDPAGRLDLVPFDFGGKSVLDIGCNQGGMLHALQGRIKHGVGIDFDARLINIANRIKAANDAHNLHFYVFDVERDPLDLIRDLCPEQKVDIVFLLSVCRWLPNWRDVLRFSAGIADTMLFESNGMAEQQDQQINALSDLYPNVDCLAEKSEDDRRLKNRMLFLASRPALQAHLAGGEARQASVGGATPVQVSSETR